MKIQTQYRLLTLAALTMIGIGTVFYHMVEKWTWIDSVYFCVVTLATVGYGDFVPTTDLGKIFTIVYILAGIGIIAAFANSLLQRAIKHREDKVKSKKQN